MQNLGDMAAFDRYRQPNAIVFNLSGAAIVE
jgi:hypothetical protein